MEVKIAQNAGFCFGVKRAMKMAWDELENKGKNDTYSLGPLIHNKQAVDKYKEKGLIEKEDLEEIVIDQERCPNTAREFLGYEYEKDSNDNFKSDYPDRDNHSIDAVRYAIRDYMRNKTGIKFLK